GAARRGSRDHACPGRGSPLGRAGHQPSVTTVGSGERLSHPALLGGAMSIYATPWELKFPRDGAWSCHPECDWITVIAQGVPAHIGSPTPGSGYEDGDPYAAFLPPAVELPPDDNGLALRAVVIVTEETRKGTARSGQEYVDPLLVLT